MYSYYILSVFLLYLYCIVFYDGKCVASSNEESVSLGYRTHGGGVAGVRLVGCSVMYCAGPCSVWGGAESLGVSVAESFGETLFGF